jgi:hypothetical protein
LHQAISADNDDMLEVLLGRGLNPNTRSLIAGCQAFTPMEHAIRTGNIKAYRRLYAHPLADTSLLTPAYRIHILHLAVAQLRVDILEATKIPLSESLSTALGHTLGHIACLPFDETHLQLFSSKVRESIHDLRSLHLPVDWPYNPRLDFTLFAERHYQHISRLSEPDYPGPGDEDSIGIPRALPPVKERRSDLPDQIFFEPPSAQFSGAQAEVMKRLVQELGIEIVLIKD